MIKLSEIVEKEEVVKVIGTEDCSISGLAFDSREVEPGFAFIAVKGTQTNGHKYIDNAINKGAIAVVCETLPKNIYPEITWVQVNDSAKILGIMASKFYGEPSAKMRLIGVTGTNGKTTIATLLFRLARELGHKAGLISTIVYRIDNKSKPASHTTPDPIQLNSLMQKMVHKGCSYCFMEVSSHALDQKRIAGLDFDGAVFTNISHDHLDYHKTFDNYIKTKKKFFDELKSGAFALSNIDDKNGNIMLQNSVATRRTYSLYTMADFMGKMLEKHFDGTLLQINGREVWTHFVGRFNVYNLLAVYGAAFLLGFKPDEILLAISKMKPVDGRFEVFRSIEGIYAVVDYAHTPDALSNVLSTIDEVRTPDEQLICVVGAGGDRDKTKRPKMASIACRFCNKIILTSDNPRTEDPLQILADMEKGIDKHNAKKVVTIPDRREAIKTAKLLASPGDIIVIAGKGHEDYQEINGVKYHFDDREEVKILFGIT
ncbi:MAG: UDP-N-acetylmuramoyl-L-alanyl-D-glutamate--2,6-diaminopimelate ligase [Prolixibacteraceae bacterium]|nr:UDP-N-acetylmuramoyl-L-alanyl-D-glutamate--2,6-diaminopimelate ligase [Prolixibacteraceae bacterium]